MALFRTALNLNIRNIELLADRGVNLDVHERRITNIIDDSKP